MSFWVRRGNALRRVWRADFSSWVSWLAATLRLRLRGWAKAVGILLTAVFNLVVAVPLFGCVDAVTPFYAVR